MKKQDRLTLDEFAALIKRIEAQSLNKGDAQILEAVIKKTLLIEQKYRQGKITSRKQLGRLLRIARPKESDD
jgi:hypothetical protein